MCIPGLRQRLNRPMRPERAYGMSSWFELPFDLVGKKNPSILLVLTDEEKE